jgi:CheY-like chemotaxis protein
VSTQARSSQTVTVLLIEDNEVDREAVQRAFQEHRIGNPLVEAADGVEALEILRGSAKRQALARPYLVLLDLNLPRMDGLEFLRELRSDPQLADAIVFVLTTSKSDEDKTNAYRANVAGYIVKGEVGEGFMRLVGLLDHYWRIVEFPEGARGTAAAADR